MTTELKGPVCKTCGVDWYRHGGFDHDFEEQPVAEPRPSDDTLTERERSARVCDEVANSEHRTVGERALAKVLAARIRGGGR